MEKYSLLEWVLILVMSLPQLLIVFGIPYFAYVVIRHKKRIDKRGNWILVRKLAQLLAFAPFVLIVYSLFYLARFVLSDTFVAGCTSGPGMGDCFGMNVLIAVGMVATLIMSLASFVLYLMSTQKKPKF